MAYKGSQTAKRPILYTRSTPAMPDFDWRELFTEYEAFGGTVPEFCEHKSLSVSIASKIFSAIEKENNDRKRQLVSRKLHDAGMDAAKNIISKIASPDERISLEASKQVLKSIGLDGAGMSVNIDASKNLTDNRVQVNFYLPENGRGATNIEASVDETAEETKKLIEHDDGG